MSRTPRKPSARLPRPGMTRRGFLEVGRRAAVSSHHGFQLHGRGTFKLPPIPEETNPYP